MEKLDRMAEIHQHAKAAADGAWAALQQEVVAAVAGGMAEAEAARRAGVDRMTVRKWLGKR